MLDIYCKVTVNSYHIGMAFVPIPSYPALRKSIFMTRSILLFLIFFQAFFPFAISQKLHKADKEIIVDLQSDISYLSNDKLEGRRYSLTLQCHWQSRRLTRYCIAGKRFALVL